MQEPYLKDPSREFVNSIDIVYTMYTMIYYVYGQFSQEAGKMADESEDQWLYGDSTDGKEYTPTNIQSEVQQNDSMLAEVQENSQTQEDQKVEGVGEASSEVCARPNLSRSFTMS